MQLCVLSPSCLPGSCSFASLFISLWNDCDLQDPRRWGFRPHGWPQPAKADNAFPLVYLGLLVTFGEKIGKNWSSLSKNVQKHGRIPWKRNTQKMFGTLSFFKKAWEVVSRDNLMWQQLIGNFNHDSKQNVSSTVMKSPVSRNNWKYKAPRTREVFWYDWWLKKKKEIEK